MLAELAPASTLFKDEQDVEAASCEIALFAPELEGHVDLEFANHLVPVADVFVVDADPQPFIGENSKSLSFLGSQIAKLMAQRDVKLIEEKPIEAVDRCALLRFPEFFRLRFNALNSKGCCNLLDRCEGVQRVMQ